MSETTTSQPEIQVYTNGPACMPCRATKRELKKLGLECEELDARDELIADEARAYAARFNLGLETPLILVARGGQVIDAWTGHRPDRLRALTA